MEILNKPVANPCVQSGIVGRHFVSNERPVSSSGLTKDRSIDMIIFRLPECDFLS